jgi:large subunit ribosomal protein L9
VVRVKPGYARNFLFPKKMAERATKANLERFQEMRIQLEAHNLKLKQEAQALAERMHDIKLTMVRPAGENGLLYGSVRPQDIVDSLGVEGYTVVRGQVHIKAPIKTLGVHSLVIHLHPEVDVTIQLAIALTQEEADALFAKSS